MSAQLNIDAELNRSEIIWRGWSELPQSAIIWTERLVGFAPKDIKTCIELCSIGIERTGQFLDVGDIEAVLMPAPQDRKPPTEWGLAACAPDNRMIKIFLDLENPRWRHQDGKDKFSRTVAHELHHVIRQRQMGGYGSMLIDRLVHEGLAMNFEAQTGHAHLPDKIYNPSERDIEFLSTMAIPFLLQEHDANGCFGANTDHPFPSGGEYQLGNILIMSYLDENNLTASSAVTTRSEEVNQWWRNKDYRLSELMAYFYLQADRHLLCSPKYRKSIKDQKLTI